MLSIMDMFNSGAANPMVQYYMQNVARKLPQAQAAPDATQPVSLTSPSGQDNPDWLSTIAPSSGVPDSQSSRIMKMAQQSAPMSEPQYEETSGAKMEADAHNSLDDLMMKLQKGREDSKQGDRAEQWMSFFSKMAQSKSPTILGSLGDASGSLTETIANQDKTNKVLDQAALQDQIKYEEYKREQDRLEAAQRSTEAYQRGQLGLDRAKLAQGKFQMSPYGQVLNTRTGEIKDTGSLTGLPTSAVDDKGNPLVGDDYLKTLDPRVATLAKQYANGDVAWPSGFALKNPMVLQATIAAQQYDPTANGNRFSAVKAFNTGKQGDLVRSLDVSTQHLDVLDTLGKALKSGDVKLLNSANNAWKEQFGEEAPTDFNTAKTIVANEVVKSIVGGQNAEADRAKAQAAFDAAKSPEQLSGALRTVKSLMKGQINGVKQQYENSTGRKDFYSRLTPATQKVFQDSPDDSSGAEPDKSHPLDKYMSQ